MLEETGLRQDTRGMPADDGGAGRLKELAARLASLQVSVQGMPCAAGTTAGGVALPVEVGDAYRDAHRDATADPLLRRVCTLLREAVPVTLSLRSLGEGDEAAGRLEDFCTALRRTLVQESLGGDSIGLAMNAGVMPMALFLSVCGSLLGAGPRFALLDRRQMRHHDDWRLQDRIDHDWSFLWRRRDVRTGLQPAYAGSVTTPCPLLDDERATAVLPQPALQVPPSSAWLPLELRLADFSDGRGRLDWERLRLALCACVDLGDRLLDHLVWPEAGQRADACLNRRLAVNVAGIGDLIIEYGADPGDLRTLQWAERLMSRVSKTLWSRSRILAKRSGVLPALTHGDPTAGSPAMARKGDWQRRWRNAVARAAVRHRNLLVVSPYAVLPSGDHDVKDFIDLLPALHHADAFSFSDPVTRGCRSVDEFVAFHRRAFAVMERRNAASLVAAGA